MNCAAFAKMDQIFSQKNKTSKKYWKNGKKYWKSQGILSVQKSGNPAPMLEKVSWSKRLSSNAGRQEISRCCITGGSEDHAGDKACKWIIYPAFKTHGRQKSKRGVPVDPQKGLVSSKNLKKTSYMYLNKYIQWVAIKNNCNVWYLNELPDKLLNFIDIFKIENERCE